MEYFFFASWMNLAGRIFHSNQSGNFSCHTYPVYKPIDAPEFGSDWEKTVRLVPEENPNYKNLPWANMTAWIQMTIVNSLVMGIVFCFIYTYFSSRKASPMDKHEENEKLIS